MLSSPGIGSNLDVNGIVSQLMAAERQPLVALTRREASFQARLSAMGSIKGALSNFQNVLRSLSDASKFVGIRGTIGDSSVASISTSAASSPGSYALEVSKLAQAQKLVSVGQASTSAPIGAGTLTFDFGSVELGDTGSFDSTTGKYTGASFTSNGSGAKTVTIEPGASSLTGIRDAINKANIGVTASIINDGGTSPFRLVLTETRTGAANSVRISVSGDAALENLLGHDPAAGPGAQALRETVSAQNAEFKIDGVAITKSGNTVTDAIQGVTLTLTKTNAGNPTNVVVSRDASGITGAVAQFVQAFNQINQTLRDLTAYNPQTKQAAILNGDATVRTIQNQLRSVLSASIGGGESSLTVLSQIGVSFQRDGTLGLDNAKLQKAVETHGAGIARLFGATGNASDSLLTYLGASAKTVPGSYPVNISQIATRGSTTGEAAAALTIDGSNDTLQIRLDGVTASLTLPHRTYQNAADLAAELQARINGLTAFSGEGIAATVTESGGVLSITSQRLGSASSASVLGGSGKTDLFGANPTSTAGQDVAGTINGVTAIGAGMVLTGPSGSAVEGLRIEVGGPQLGNRGTIGYALGYASQLNRLAEQMLGASGAIAARTDGLNATLKSLESQKQRLNDRLVDIEKRYRAQFTALDRVLGSMTQTSMFLQQQLANLPKIDQR